MKKSKIALISISSFIGIIVVAFLLNLGGLQWKKFFSPKYQNVERSVFEETKSYVHAVQQDLGKYYAEYQKADADERIAIESVIRMRFAEFDENNIQNNTLRNFLVAKRGF